MNVYYDKDANKELIKNKRVAVIGYGSQGHAHANNLRDAGCEVIVGLRAASNSWDKALEQGLEVDFTREAVTRSDVVMLLVPDELQGIAYPRR